MEEKKLHNSIADSRIFGESATSETADTADAQHIFGYVRDNATVGADTADLSTALLSFGVEKIIRDNNDELTSLLSSLHPSDTIVIPSINHLGDNFKEILLNLKSIVEKQSSLVILDVPLFDTKTGSTLTGSEMQTLILQLLTSVYSTDKQTRKARQAEGIAAAKAEGKAWGPKGKERTKKFEKLAKQWKEGVISSRDAGKILGITHRTFMKWAREYNGEP